MPTGPLPSPGQVVEVKCFQTIGVDLSGLTRFFLSYTGDVPDTAQLNTFAAAVGTAWGAQIKAWQTSDTILDTVEVIDLSSDIGATGEASPAIVGTRAGDFLPADNCFVVTYDIARRYRGGHARGYWRIGAWADLDNAQTWMADVVTDFPENLASFFSDLAADGWAMAGTIGQVQVSWFSGFTAVENPITGRYRNVPNKRVTPVVNAVTGLTGRARIGSQRRRLGKS